MYFMSLLNIEMAQMIEIPHIATNLFYVVNAMAADDLAMEGARATAATAYYLFPKLAPKDPTVFVFPYKCFIAQFA